MAAHQIEAVSHRSNRVRKLLFASDPEPPWNSTGHHPIRHRKHKARLSEGYYTTRQHYSTRNEKANQYTVLVDHLKNASWQQQQETKQNVSEISVRLVDQHSSCFTSNEVVEIIGITCLVNFLFWFLIIACVNFHTRNHRTYTSSSCDSLLNADDDDDDDCLVDENERGSSNCETYVPRVCDVTVEMQPLVKLKRPKCRWKSNKIISVDNLRPLPQNRTRLSLSMERLIF